MKRLILIALMLIASPAMGAIAHDASTVWTTSTTSTECSFTHTPSGTPTLALLWVSLDADETISGTPTYGGTSMTLVTNNSGSSDPAAQTVYLYELHSPSSGAQTAYAAYSSDNNIVCVAQTFTGTHATDATVETDTYDNSGGTCATAATTLTLNETTSWMVTMAVWDGGDQDPLAPTNYTFRNNGVTDTLGTGDQTYGHGDSTGNSGSRTHTTAPASTADECAQVSVELIPAAATGTGTAVTNTTFSGGVTIDG